MVDQIRWGILSTAKINGALIPAIEQSTNGKLVAVASRSAEKARAYAAEHNIPTAYGSYEELLADPNIDAIYNPLPNSEHAVWSIRAAEAGKATLCEKPLAADAAEAQQMVDAFASRNLLFAEAFMYRFHPQTQRVQEMIAEGAIGDLRVIQANFSFPIRSEDNIRLDKGLAGGALMDVGCYCVNVMRLMTGEEPVYGQAIARFGEQSQVDETLVATLDFPSGALGHLDCGFRSYLGHSYEIRGTKGRIRVSRAFVLPPTSGTVIHYESVDGDAEIAIPAANHYKLMVEDFGDALIHHRAPRFAPQDAVSNMRVIDMLLDSARATANR